MYKNGVSRMWIDQRTGKDLDLSGQGKTKKSIDIQKKAPQSTTNEIDTRRKNE